MLEIFIIGTFWFWALVIAEIVLLFVFIENENGFAASISLLVFAAALQWFGNVDLIGYVAANPMSVVACIGAYFILGAVWGICKWWIYCRDQLEDYHEFRNDWLRGKGLNDTKSVPVELRADFKTALDRHNSNRYRQPALGEPPKASQNKGRIMRWMTFWWVSMVWSFLDDFVKRVFRVIYYRIANFLQSIADNMFSGAREDLEVPDNEE